jgi:hypothetical protein
MFVSRGQTELQKQEKTLRDRANQYRAVGKFAVKYGGPEVKRQAGSKLDTARRACEETFTGLIVNRGGGESTESPAPTKTPTARDAAPKREPAKAEPAKVEARGPVNGATNGSGNGNGAAVRPPATPAPELAIPEYDQLSASQVVERLEGLSAGELDAVRDYEQAHRGRNTILGKITQLTS